MKAKDVKVGDRVVVYPHLGDRSYAALSVRREGPYVQIVWNLKGTHHYRPGETLCEPKDWEAARFGGKE